MVGDDGKPVGDLNWYPEYAERWDPDVLIVGVEADNDVLPEEFALIQNYPNPFNPTTKIKYSIPSAGKVKLAVYDILGKEIAVLVNDKQQSAGTYVLDFDGSRYSSGVYFYRIITQGRIITQKMMLIK